MAMQYLDGALLGSKAIKVRKAHSRAEIQRRNHEREGTMMGTAQAVGEGVLAEGIEGEGAAQAAAEDAKGLREGAEAAAINEDVVSEDESKEIFAGAGAISDEDKDRVEIQCRNHEREVEMMGGAQIAEGAAATRKGAEAAAVNEDVVSEDESKEIFTGAGAINDEDKDRVEIQRRNHEREVEMMGAAQAVGEGAAHALGEGAATREGAEAAAINEDVDSEDEIKEILAGAGVISNESKDDDFKINCWSDVEWARFI